jgi:hypothetical protein
LSELAARVGAEAGALRPETPPNAQERPAWRLPSRGEFRILEHVQPSRKSGRNWIARCPSCAAAGHDTSGDNLAISVEDPRKYLCWAGCTKEMIREVLGHPIPARAAGQVAGKGQTVPATPLEPR